MSKASDDLPDPDTPLTTVSFPWGISQEMFFRLCVRAPRITIASLAEVKFVAGELGRVKLSVVKGKAPMRIRPTASLSPQRGSKHNRPFFIIGQLNLRDEIQG